MKAQCYATPEISTSFASHENLEIQTNLGDLAEKILKDQITISSEMPICNEEKEYCVATLETCVDTNSLIRPDKLDDFKEHFGNLIALASRIHTATVSPERSESLPSTKPSYSLGRHQFIVFLFVTIWSDHIDFFLTTTDFTDKSPSFRMSWSCAIQHHSQKLV